MSNMQLANATIQSPVLESIIKKNSENKKTNASESKNDSFQKENKVVYVTQPPRVDDLALNNIQVKQKKKGNFIDGALKFVGMVFLSCLAGNCIYKLPKLINLFGKKKGNMEEIWSDLSKAPSVKDLALPTKLQDTLKMITQSINNVINLKKQGGSPVKTILLYGPPGTGKTTFAKAVAKDIPNSRFTELDITSLSSSYVGGTERNIQKKVEEICKQASKNNDIKYFVFIDEIDSVMLKDDSVNENYTNAVLNEFKKSFTEKLGQYDNIITIGATNRLINSGDLDEAMVDRFQYKLFIGLPTKEQIKKAIANHYVNCTNVEKILKDESKLDEIANNLQQANVSFRDLNTIFNKAPFIQQNDFTTMDDFIEASKCIIKEKNSI